MNEFLNLNDDDEAEDEEGAAKVTVEATVREGNVARQGMKARVANQVAEIHGTKTSVSVSARGTTRKRLQISETDPLKGSKAKKSFNLFLLLYNH